MLYQQNLVTGKNKIETAINRISELCAGKKIIVGFSGGKDSTVILDLAARAGIDFTAAYRVVGIDPPEVVRFVKSVGVKFSYPELSWWKLIEKNKGVLPNRFMRYCCRELKETPPHNGEIMITGIRWSESNARSVRTMTESCRIGGGHYLHPVIDWTEAEIWEYIKLRKLPYCSLYDQGFSRCGCMGCPMKSESLREVDFLRWPWFREKMITRLRRINEQFSVKDKVKHFQSLWLHCRKDIL